MFTLPGSKQWTIKYNQYIICDLIFFPQLIISLVAIVWETLSSASAHLIAINRIAWIVWPDSTNRLHAWVLADFKGTSTCRVYRQLSFTEHPHWHVCTASSAVGSQALLGHLSPAVTQIVISTVCLVFSFFFLFSIFYVSWPNRNKSATFILF